MNREEAVSIIEDRVRVTEYVESSYVDCVDIEALKMAIEALRQPKQQWIPCSERLPEEEVEVFVCLFDRPLPYIAWISKGGKWHTEDFTLEADDNPVAWMPLPNAYEGK